MSTPTERAREVWEYHMSQNRHLRKTKQTVNRMMREPIMHNVKVQGRRYGFVVGLISGCLLIISIWVVASLLSGCGQVPQDTDLEPQGPVGIAGRVVPTPQDLGLSTTQDATQVQPVLDAGLPSVYLVSNVSWNWTDAKQYCTTIGAHLPAQPVEGYSNYDYWLSEQCYYSTMNVKTQAQFCYEKISDVVCVK